MEAFFLEEFSKIVTIIFFTEKKALKNGFKNKIFEIRMALPKRYQKCRKVPKSADLFFCKLCDYTTSQKSHFNKHLQTKKHKKKALPNVTKMLPKSAEKCRKVYICENCDKEYKSRKGLWSHKKKCCSYDNPSESDEYMFLMKKMMGKT